MRNYKFPMVMLIGLLCVASRASAQKEPHAAPGSAGEARRGVGNAPHDRDHPAAQNAEGRRGGGVDGKNNSNSAHIDGANQGAVRHDPSSVNARGVPNANIAGQNAWRYRQQNNRWWYWTPNNSWVYWNNGAWVPYGSVAVGGPRNYGGRYPYASGYRGLASSGGYLGVTFDQRSPNMAVIAQVSDNSPAAQAGLKPGDAIRAINGESIQSPYQPSELIARIAAGTKISLAIERDRQTSDVPVVLGQR